MEPGRPRKLVTAALALAMFLAALEATAVGTAMPTVVAELGGVSRYSWVFSAYLLASTTTVPMYGKLADLFGRLRIFTIAVVLFLLGAALCGAAQTFTQLISLQSHPGPRGRRRHPGRHHRGRRHLLPGGEGADPGHLLRSLGHFLPGGPSRRRAHHRSSLLAVGLLSEPPLRPRLRRHAPLVPEGRGAPERAPAGPPGDPQPHRFHRPPPPGPPGRDGALGLERPPDPGHDRHVPAPV